MDKLIQDLISKLQGTNTFNWVGVWNNQYEKMKTLDGYAIQNPSAYVEIETSNFHQLGESYQGIDIVMNIHILSEELDAGDGTMDSFFSIYVLRDTVVKELSLYEAYMGGFMTKVNEIQQYDHDNLYHYIISYTMHYIDDTAKKTYSTITGTTLSANTVVLTGITINR